jgi:hypothetical protein
MTGSNRILELTESQMGEKKLQGLIKNPFTEHLCMQFYVKAKEKVFFDPK